MRETWEIENHTEAGAICKGSGAADAPVFTIKTINNVRYVIECPVCWEHVVCFSTNG